MVADMNWVRAYKDMNLKTLNIVVRAALPSMMTLGTQVILGTLEVKGAATLASASDKEMPAWAAFNAWRPEMLKTCYLVHEHLPHNRWLHLHTY